MLTILKILFKNQQPFYLPASRLFYPHFYEYIFRYEKDRREEIWKQLGDLLTSKSQLVEENFSMYRSRYTKPVDALISKIFELNEKPVDISSENKNYSKNLEKIIGGKIIFHRKEGVSPVEFYLTLQDSVTKEDANLEMHLSSSSINQLTTLYLFFKYWAEDKHNFLIIDEPEENLHPESQIHLLNLLIKFSKNNRVLITTHSPSLTKALNNHIYLGILKSHNVDIKRLVERETIDIDPNSTLNHEDIGIYFFDGNYIRSYEIEKYGALFANFKEVERKIENISEILTDEIYYLEETNRD